MEKRIIIEPYNPAWEASFEALAAVFRSSLGGLIDDVQHVGSTSVRGLAAKPILDIDLIIGDMSLLPAVAQALARLGYEHRGNQGISDREAFGRNSAAVPLTGTGQTWMAHHLYVCPAGSLSLKNHLTLRDYLGQHPEEAMQYAELKRQLAHRHPTDIDAYVQGKTAFITGILGQAGFHPDPLRRIMAENGLAED